MNFKKFDFMRIRELNLHLRINVVPLKKIQYNHERSMNEIVDEIPWIIYLIFIFKFDQCGSLTKLIIETKVQVGSSRFCLDEHEKSLFWSRILLHHEGSRYFY